MADLQPMKSKKLEGKVAIVTGGASGIGEATAHNFINHGARAVVIADIQDEKGQNVAASIDSDRCTYIHCDVTDEDQVKSLVESTVSIYGCLDIMFSNAGISSLRSQTVLDLEFSEFDKIMTVNARGMAACVKHAARAMKEGGVRGSIICTSSVLGSRGAGVSTDYAMSKHAVVGLMRSASLQLAGHGIRVNCVSPGPVGTPGACKTLGIDEERADEVVEPLSRLKGVLRKKHVAEAVSFLASDESEFVTGLDLAVDGGFVAPAAP
ncbi:(+)-cis,trans-nepetalactol synthase NEPS1-like [Ziziphus jujuba]|uniref:(+)-cis,trans-nepetalactol synthase NEPS1-like n=1 Tax=Ziziphus jujuba TaxID=326968 RepID=A0A6P4A5U2_ZIZJJ|nr:(+)-cis,trans-nepetalactol synthase NEPS1-like [Ziziphus jujuba]